jgi:hypothetical protein
VPWIRKDVAVSWMGQERYEGAGRSTSGFQEHGAGRIDSGVLVDINHFAGSLALFDHQEVDRRGRVGFGGRRETLTLR